MDDDSSSKFIESLTKFLQSLCNGYVEFNRGVELVGHIYLNIDTGEKVDYILHEKVSKNDENSVTFVSNSFHALAKEREGKTGGASANASKTANPRSASEDDDDILILDQPDSGIVGSTNSGTLSTRGVKRPAPGGSDQRRPGPPMHRGQGSSMGRQPGSWRNRQQAGPSATISSQNTSQGNLSIGEVKLEQISSDELLSLASHVDGTSSQGRVGSGAQSDHGSFSPNDAPGQGWIKQEPTDDSQRGLDTGWSQSDSSNSGSNLYPVMMHQNSSGFSSSAPVHGFSPTGAASSRHSFGQSLPGTSSASPFASPMPGTSQNMSGMDPSELTKKRLLRNARQREYWQKHVRQDPEKYERFKEASRQRMRDMYQRRKAAAQQHTHFLIDRPLFHAVHQPPLTDTSLPEQTSHPSPNSQQHL